MHHYDVAAKVLIDNCRDEMLRRFLGIDVAASSLIEGVPQETATVRRSDFPLRVQRSDGSLLLVVLEIQTRWEAQLPMRLLEYRCRHVIAEGLPAVSAVLLLQADSRAVDSYEDAEVRYGFRLIRLYEMDANTALTHWPTCLLPFVPLMKGGADAIRQAEEAIYGADLPSVQRADMLTSMTILSGLVSDRLVQDILSRRRDLMIESAAYDIIKQEGIQQGIAQGIQQGLTQGIQQGLTQGIQQGLTQGIQQGRMQARIEAMREHLIDLLTVRFGAPSKQVIQRIMAIEDLSVLQALKTKLMTASSMRSFASVLKKIG